MKRLWIFLFVILAVIGGFAGHTVWLAGEFKSLDPHFAGTCKPVEGVAGAEDIVIHGETGMAYISSDDRRRIAAGEDVLGAIWGYNLADPDAVPVNLTPDLKFPFHPHGLGLFAQGDDAEIMVVNHRDGGVFEATDDTVEVFAIEGAGLRHLRTIKGDMLLSANDVAPVGKGRFYATIDHGNPTGLLRTIEDYGRLPLSRVVYFDGTLLRQVADGFRYANGINTSRDGDTVFVAATTDLAVFAFGRDEGSGDLWAKGKFETGTGVDNIDVDADGALWIGAHPKMLTFVGHSKDATKLSPSQVLRIDPASGRVSEIYLNNGEELSGSSVAARFGKRMLIGPVLDPKFLDCTLP